MKYLIVLGDGMADKNIPELDNRTPLDYADTPAMDKYSKLSEIGMVRTVPEGMAPGSDTANLSVLGYNPREYYIDHSSSEISTEDAAVLLEAVRKELETDIYKFYVGTSYRHLTIWDKGEVVELTPPHDVLGQVIGQYLPKTEALREMMKKSYDILSNHPINVERMKKGLNPANSIWFWGAGTRPALAPFVEKTGHTGAMISAVDLLKGIAVGADMKVVEVEGANGGLDTNYEGKADAAVEALLKDDLDFAYIHLEAPDEMGHQGSFERKVQAIENLDKRIIKRVTEQLEAAGTDFRMLVLPDHPTPVAIRTHVSDPVPYMLYDSTNKQSHTWNYNEKEAQESGNYIDKGYTIINHLFEK